RANGDSPRTNGATGCRRWCLYRPDECVLHLAGRTDPPHQRWLDHRAFEWLLPADKSDSGMVPIATAQGLAELAAAGLSGLDQCRPLWIRIAEWVAAHHGSFTGRDCLRAGLLLAGCLRTWPHSCLGIARRPPLWAPGLAQSLARFE